MASFVSSFFHRKEYTECSYRAAHENLRQAAENYGILHAREKSGSVFSGLFSSLTPPNPALQEKARELFRATVIGMPDNLLRAKRRELQTSAELIGLSLSDISLKIHDVKEVTKYIFNAPKEITSFFFKNTSYLGPVSTLIYGYHTGNYTPFLYTLPSTVVGNYVFNSNVTDPRNSFLGKLKYVGSFLVNTNTCKKITSSVASRIQGVSTWVSSRLNTLQKVDQTVNKYGGHILKNYKIPLFLTGSWYYFSQGALPLVSSLSIVTFGILQKATEPIPVQLR